MVFDEFTTHANHPQMKFNGLAIDTMRILPILFALVTLPACNKIEQLKAETATLEVRRDTVLKEIAGYDQRMRALNADGLISKAPTLLSGAKKDLAEAERLETEAREKLAKWAEAEASLNDLKDKVAAYKAKHVK